MSRHPQRTQGIPWKIRGASRREMSTFGTYLMML